MSRSEGDLDVIVGGGKEEDILVAQNLPGARLPELLAPVRPGAFWVLGFGFWILGFWFWV